MRILLFYFCIISLQFPFGQFNFFPMNFQTARLAAKVKATNRANANANALYAAFAAAAKPFIGQKIFKADGELTTKFKAALPALPFYFYQSRSNYSLSYVTKESESIEGQSSCIYAESYAYIASVRLSALVQLHDAPNLRTDFTVEEIAKARKDVEDAETALDVLKGKLSGFGMYDR